MDATILEAIPGANPSGANLRYEAIYAEIRARVRRARGEVVPDPDDPNFHGTDVEWRFVIGACRDLLRRRSKDLMLAAWLTEAQLAVDGLAGVIDLLATYLPSEGVIL
ncbi:MAG TPA: type VI secretion system ImpA family N-terminal domain-containing protein [Alloacidobacterium sp.]|nr:type VI secretion system ImpA family N-terminal domain-containing protein [Alloacidobacterium sp.]